MRKDYESIVAGQTVGSVPERINGAQPILQQIGSEAGRLSGTRMSGKDWDTGQVLYPFSYSDAVEVLKLVQQSEFCASLDLNIGDIRLSIRRADSGTTAGPALRPREEPSGETEAIQVPDRKAGSPGKTHPEASAASGATAAPDPTAARQSAPPAAENLEKILTPTLGVFYRRSAPGAAPFVEEGDIVAADDQIGLLEVMKLYMPITAGVAGRIVKIVAEDAVLVEHGDVLMLIEPI